MKELCTSLPSLAWFLTLKKQKVLKSFVMIVTQVLDPELGIHSSTAMRMTMGTASFNVVTLNFPISLLKQVKKPGKRVYMLQANWEAGRNDWKAITSCVC